MKTQRIPAGRLLQKGKKPGPSLKAVVAENEALSVATRKPNVWIDLSNWCNTPTRC